MPLLIAPVLKLNPLKYLKLGKQCLSLSPCFTDHINPKPLVFGSEQCMGAGACVLGCRDAAAMGG